MVLGQAIVGPWRTARIAHLAVVLLVATVRTAAAGEFAVDPAVGIWVNAAELAHLPMSGDAWDDLYAAASVPCSIPDLTEMGDDADACVLAKAIVSRRLQAANPADPQVQTLRNEVLTGLAQMMDEANWCDNGFCSPCDEFGVGEGTCTRKTVAVGRNLGAYLAAAELIGLDALDSPSRGELIAFLEGTGNPADPEEIQAGILNYAWTDAGTIQAPSNQRTLREAHDERPNNWGGHVCGSLAAAAIFRERSDELLQIYGVERGWAGDCSLGDCSQFAFDPEATDWTCDQTPPSYSVNKGVGCIVDVDPGPGVDLMDLGGVQVDDMRRGGPFPAGCNGSPRACVADVHIWGGLQGRIACAYILRRQGLDLFTAAAYALLRAYAFQHRPIWMIAGVPGQTHPPHVSQDGTPNDDAFLAYIVNYVYRANYPVDPAAGGPGYHDFGKGFGWTRYTLGENPCGWLAADSNFDGVCDAALVPALPAWGSAAGGVLFLAASAAYLARRPRRPSRPSR